MAFHIIERFRSLIVIGAGISPYFFFFLLNYFCDSLYLFTLFNLERSKIIGLSLIVREFLDYFSLRQVNFHSKQMMASQVIPVNGLVT